MDHISDSTKSFILFLHRDPKAEEKMNPFAEQEAWEEHQIGNFFSDVLALFCCAVQRNSVFLFYLIILYFISSYYFFQGRQH